MWGREKTRSKLVGKCREKWFSIEKENQRFFIYSKSEDMKGKNGYGKSKFHASNIQKAPNWNLLFQFYFSCFFTVFKYNNKYSFIYTFATRRARVPFLAAPQYFFSSFLWKPHVFVYFLVCLLKCWLLLVDSFTFVNRHCVCVCVSLIEMLVFLLYLMHRVRVLLSVCMCVACVCESLVVGFEKVCKKFEVKYKY